MGESVPAPPDILLLYWTLVKDGVLQGGYESQFTLLETAILKGARRTLKRTAGSDNLTAAVWLHQRNLQSKQKERSERLAVDQFLLAALNRPSKFRASWQEKYYDGPNAGRGAEEALRAKWLQELEALLKGTKTPMGEAFVNRPGDKSFLGGGRRASTPRARVRASKKYLAWLAVSADVPFPSEVSHLTGFLESRHSEPCNRGKRLISAWLFWRMWLELTRSSKQTLSTQLCTGSSSPQRNPVARRDRHPATQWQYWSRLKNWSSLKVQPFTSGSTRGGCSFSVGGRSGSQTTEDSTRGETLR